MLLAEKTLTVLCLTKSYAEAFFMSSAHLEMELIKTNSQMMIPNDLFSLGGSAEDTGDTLQHCSQGSLYKQGEELIGSFIGRDELMKRHKR